MMLSAKRAKEKTLYYKSLNDGVNLKEVKKFLKFVNKRIRILVKKGKFVASFNTSWTFLNSASINYIKSKLMSKGYIVYYERHELGVEWE